MLKYFFVSLFALCIATSMVRAEDAIAPFVDDLTVAVARVDVAAIDWVGVETWAGQALKDSGLPPDQQKDAEKMLHEMTAASAKWTTSFIHAGGRTLYAVASFGDARSPMFFVAPLEKGADEAALRKLLAPANGVANRSYGIQSSPEKMHGALVFGPGGSDLSYLKQLAPEPRPNLAAAFAEAGDAPVRVAIIPPDAARKVAEGLLPELPGHLPMTVVTRGVKWASLRMQLAPKAGIGLTVQSEDANARDALSNLIGLCLAAARTQGAGPARELAKEIPPAESTKDNQLKLDLNEQKSKAVVGQLIGLALQARSQSAVTISMNHLRELVLACLNYADGHKGQFPATLEQAIAGSDLPAEVLRNPSRPEVGRGYTYLRPTEKKLEPAMRALIYESFETWPGQVNVGFADGHVELIRDHSQFEKLLESAK